MANKAYVYAIYPNKEQAELCQKTFGCCRFVYNQMLTVQKGVEIIFEEMMERIVDEYMKMILDKSIVFIEKPNKTYPTKENDNAT